MTSRPRVAFYFPLFDFKEVHLFKDSEILSRLAHEGIECELIVGRSEVPDSSHSWKLIETRIARKDFPVSDVREAFFTLRELSRLRPTHCIITLNSRGMVSPAIVAGYKLIASLGRRRGGSVPPRFIMFVDWDGESGLFGVRRGLFRAYMLIANSLFNEFMVQSSCSHDALAKFLARPEKVQVYSLGCDGGGLTITDYDAVTREPVVLTVGRICRDKGTDIVLEAFASARRENPTWTLRVVGPIEDRDFFRALTARAAQLGIASSVTWVDNPPRSEILHEYARASVFCAPSRIDGFSLARLEAMASGVPIVVSSAGCGRDLGAMGARVLPIGDVEGTAKALAELMESPALRVAQARAQQRDLVTWTSIARRLVRDLEGQAA